MPLKKFKKNIADKIEENPFGEGTEYKIYPPNLKDPYEARRKEVGKDMYDVLKIPKEDKKGRLKQFRKNFEFFGANFFLSSNSQKYGVPTPNIY